MSGFLLVLAVLGQDVTPPVFLDLWVDPVYIDCSEGDQVVTVYAEISDDLSGIRDHSSATIGFHSPSGTYNSVIMSDRDMVSGDYTHAWYEDQLIFGQYSEFGVWRMDFLYSVDNLNNRSRLEGAEVPFDLTIINGPIPEPSTLALALSGLLTLACCRRLRRRRLR